MKPRNKEIFTPMPSRKARLGTLLLGSLLVFSSTLGTWSACPNDSDDVEADASLQDALVGDVGPDSGSPDAVPRDAGDALPMDGAAGCKPAVQDPAALGHAAGQDCLSCHDNIGGDLHFNLAGTAYDTITGDSPLAGATVTLVDDSGKVVDVHTGSNGNFYTLEPVTFPVTVVLSRCPNLIEMPQPLTSRHGCNSCHGAGKRIHLP